MIDAYSRIATMRDMFFYGHGLCSWCFDANYQLLSSNADNPLFFGNVFFVSPCFDIAQKHFEQNTTPIILSDKTGIAWIITSQTEQGKILASYLLGPFFSVETSDSYLRQLCSRLSVSGELIDDLMKQLKKIPSIPLGTAIRYAVMLQYAVMGEACTADDIALHMEDSGSNPEEAWNSSTWHGTWELEQKLFKQLRDGNVRNTYELLSQFSAGHIGVACPDNPLRQAKDEIIVFTALCCRAVILGGVSPEGSYNLADYFIQKIEACEHVSSLQNLSIEMFNTYLRRSRLAKTQNAYSVPIAAAMEYVENHIHEKVNLDAMACEVGYTTYYLSNKFQKEVGMSINSFIQKRKIENAKEMLLNSHVGIADVSEQLAFSSPSYFSSIFRKLEGITPGDFLKRNEK